MSVAVKERPAAGAVVKRRLNTKRAGTATEQSRTGLTIRRRIVSFQRTLNDRPGAKTDSGKPGPGKTEKLSVAELRAALGWTRNQLGYVLNASDRAIVNWEGGAPLSPVYASKLLEFQSLYTELNQLMKPEEIGPWLRTDMEEFDGQSPADLFSKGETGRLWASLFYLRSGMPD